MDTKTKKVVAGGLVLGGIGLGIWALTRKGSAGPAPGTATMYGKVRDAITNQLLAEVTISLDGLQTGSDASGSYTFASVEPRAYSVSLAKEGFYPYATNVALTADVALQADFYLTPTSEPEPPPSIGGTISGRVYDWVSGEPIQGALLSLTGPATLSTLSASDGTYEFNVPSLGIYTITCSKAGYETKSKDREINEDGDTELANFGLVLLDQPGPEIALVGNPLPLTLTRAEYVHPEAGSLAEMYGYSLSFDWQVNWNHSGANYKMMFSSITIENIRFEARGAYGGYITYRGPGVYTTDIFMRFIGLRYGDPPPLGDYTIRVKVDRDDRYGTDVIPWTDIGVLTVVP